MLPIDRIAQWNVCVGQKPGEGGGELVCLIKINTSKFFLKCIVQLKKNSFNITIDN